MAQLIIYLCKLCTDCHYSGKRLTPKWQKETVILALKHMSAKANENSSDGVTTLSLIHGMRGPNSLSFCHILYAERRSLI